MQFPDVEDVEYIEYVEDIEEVEDVRGTDLQNFVAAVPTPAWRAGLGAT